MTLFPDPRSAHVLTPNAGLRYLVLFSSTNHSYQANWQTDASPLSTATAQIREITTIRTHQVGKLLVQWKCPHCAGVVQCRPLVSRVDNAWYFGIVEYLVRALHREAAIVLRNACLLNASIRPLSSPSNEAVEKLTGEASASLAYLHCQTFQWKWVDLRRFVDPG